MFAQFTLVAPFYLSFTNMKEDNTRSIVLTLFEFFVHIACEVLFFVAAIAVFLDKAVVRLLKRLSRIKQLLVISTFIILLSIVLHTYTTTKAPTQITEERSLSERLSDVESKLSQVLSSPPVPVAAPIYIEERHYHKHYHNTTNTTNVQYVTVHNTTTTATTTAAEAKEDGSDNDDSYERERLDYALTANGARVTSASNTYCVNTTTFTGRIRTVCKNSPAQVLSPEVRPGECWGMAGHSGFVVVELGEAVVPRTVAVAHPTRAGTEGAAFAGAPRDFKVYGVEAAEGAGEKALLGSFMYDARSSAVTQEFELLRSRQRPHRAFRRVRVEILSNWGNPEWTCLYKIKIYGRGEKIN